MLLGLSQGWTEISFKLFLLWSLQILKADSAGKDFPLVGACPPPSLAKDRHTLNSSSAKRRKLSGSGREVHTNPDSSQAKSLSDLRKSLVKKTKSAGQGGGGGGEGCRRTLSLTPESHLLRQPRRTWWGDKGSCDYAHLCVCVETAVKNKTGWQSAC